MGNWQAGNVNGALHTWDVKQVLSGRGEVKVCRRINKEPPYILQAKSPNWQNQRRTVHILEWACIQLQKRPYPCYPCQRFILQQTFHQHRHHQLIAKRQRLCIQNDDVLGDGQFWFGMYDATTSEEVNPFISYAPISKSALLYPYWADQFHILRNCVGMNVSLQLSHPTKKWKTHHMNVG